MTIYQIIKKGTRNNVANIVQGKSSISLNGTCTPTRDGIIISGGIAEGCNAEISPDYRDL